jgi:signal transduction histidine kinase
MRHLRAAFGCPISFRRQLVSPNVFSKVLSLNDTGETGAHMGGILIPKSELAVFPTLDPHIKNPRATLEMKDRDGRRWELSFIYYNNARFDGTRDEYRLTGLTEFIKANGLAAGDTVTVTRNGENIYFLDFQKANPLEPPKWPVQTFLEMPRPETRTPPNASHDHAMRPAARIIHTIGQHLIKDPQAAVMELVKNSYDADAQNVRIRFQIGTDAASKSVLRITVVDDGAGMNYDQVTNSWLVPATPDKVSRRVSPNGRQLQGNKGIGRFAAFMLGDEIFLTTISRSSSLETSLMLQASDFRQVEFLDQIRVIVDTREATPNTKSGTSFEMTSREGDETFRAWDKTDFGKLRIDLRRMLFPFRSRNDEFRIWVEYRGFAEYGQPDGVEEIESLPVFEHFDYRIRANIAEDGSVAGVFRSPLVPGNPEEILSIRLGDLPGKPCGNVFLDLRVVDREPAALQDLLDRSRNAEESLTGISRGQLKKLLDEASGVSVYRGDFRIRPYGDTGNDWLELDRQRINNPTLFIGNNQTFGTVVIETEEKSHLEEKSDRDGLREDEHYDRLRGILSRLILELQRRRYEIRRSVGRIQKTTRVAEMLNQLKDYEKPFQRISEILLQERIDAAKIERVRNILRQDSEGRQEIIAKLEKTIAIYQGQATLGKMVGVLLHEGNRSLGILRNQSARLPVWLQRLLSAPDAETVTEVRDGLNGLTSAAESLTRLFDQIQPLGVRSRGPAREIQLVKPIRTALRALATQLSGAGIEPRVEVPEDFKVTAWEQDLAAVFLNLTENSIHWLKQAQRDAPQILFRLLRNEDGARLDIIDNGPGIPREHIVSEAIFEPHFSLKGGHGLGLPIAGEAAARNGFELKAVHSDGGAHFVLDFSPARQSP